MPRMGVYDQIKRAFQDIIAPELHIVRADIHRLDEKIDGVDARLGEKIDGIDARLSEKIDGIDARLSQKIDGIDARLAEKIDGTDARLAEKIESADVRLTVKIDGLRAETMSLRNELLAEIRRLDVRIDGVDRELRTAIDVRERLAALEARRPA